MKRRPRVGISQCLLGDAVRYDGTSRPCDIVLQQLTGLFELIAICPEVEAGLGIPRPPVQLSGDLHSPRMTGRDDASLDVTEQLTHFCDRRVPQLDSLSGYICKSRSPSCGLATTPVFIDGDCVTETADGIFIRRLRQHHPELPIIDEIALLDATRKQAFIDDVYSAFDCQ